MSRFTKPESIFEYRVFKNPKELRKNTNDRLNESALVAYVPFFDEGERVINYINSLNIEGIESTFNGSLIFPVSQNEEEESKSVLTDTEINFFEAEIKMRDMAIDKITALSGPLMTREINKLIKTSHLKADEQVFDVLYYAAIGGLVKGLRRFEVKKIEKSSTNYLFVWITTYAKKELNDLEASFGIAPSRFKKYKKISAVRKKMSMELERYATNDEVFEYFQSGKADIKTMQGPVNRKENPDGSGKFKSNQDITLELIEEQENFELNLNQTPNFDPQDEYEASIAVSHGISENFDDTLFGLFVQKHNITKEARAVLLAETISENVSEKDQDIIATISSSNYNSLKNRWRDLFRDKNGPFYLFLLRIMDNPNYTDDYKFDIPQTVKNIENFEKTIRPDRWLPLFGNKKVEIKL